MKILVRLPNWLGDMVMASGIINALPQFFSGAEVSVIVKKGLQDLVPFLPGIQEVFVFDREKNKGIIGVYSFGRMLKQKAKYDLFICLPDSLSSAIMAKGTGAKERIGYKKEGRNILLTQSFIKPTGLHRVDEYFSLIEQYTGKKTAEKKVALQHAFTKKDFIVININSEAPSRRLTAGKAAEIINYVTTISGKKIVLVGAPKEKAFVNEVHNKLSHKEKVDNQAGKTTVPQLAEILASALVVLTTDSGPAHLANALGTQTIVLFGAGNENNTAPYNAEKRKIIRLGKLSCEPCEKNICVRFGLPQCLEQLNTVMIGQSVLEAL